MEIRNLITFCTVAEKKSFTAAATTLGYAQPTITFQIRQLEEELKVPLFDRIGTHIRLTQAGTILLSYAHQILSLSTQAAQAVSSVSSPSGSLHLAGVSSLCASFLPPVIKEYSRNFPEVMLSAACLEKELIIKKVKQGNVDIGFYIDTSPAAVSFAEDFNISTPLCFVCAASSTLCGSSAYSFASLSDLPIIATESGCTYRKILEQLFRQNSLEPDIHFESENTEVVKQFTSSDIGIAFLPEIAVKQELAQKKLRKISLTEPLPDVFIHIIYRKDRFLTAAMQAFLTLCQSPSGKSQTHL